MIVSRGKVPYGMCEQRRPRSAWVDAQAYQSIPFLHLQSIILEI